MLKVDLAELIRQTGRQIVVEIDDLAPSDDDVVYASRAVGSVTISNSGSLAIVRGMVRTSVRMECARCLTELSVPVEAEIDEQYTLSDVGPTGAHESGRAIVGDEENELLPGLMDGQVMDLAVLIRQGTLLAAPLSVLCKEDCLGLCAVCGKNRNLAESGCSCVQPERHTPFAALKQLYDEENNRTDTDEN